MTGFDDLPKRLQEYLRGSKLSSAFNPYDEERGDRDRDSDRNEAGGRDKPGSREESGKEGDSSTSEGGERRIGEWFRCPNCESEAVSVSSRPDGVGYIETTVWCTDCGCEGEYTTGRSASGIWGSGRRS